MRGKEGESERNRRRCGEKERRYCKYVSHDSQLDLHTAGFAHTSHAIDYKRT